MQKEATNFLIEIQDMATDINKYVNNALYIQEQTSSTRIKVEVIKSEIELIEAEIDFAETLQNISKEKLKLLNDSNINNQASTKSIDTLNHEKIALKQQLKTNQTLLQQLTKAAEKKLNL
ncbi:hypothetical protein [Aliivibrio kagoshimensis]|uniref:hypothetical protein n=1 Tax=Aliivibrio kagoshimensis TaxID=2910230 RepID=UPI003D0BA82D